MFDYNRKFVRATALAVALTALGCQRAPLITPTSLGVDPAPEYTAPDGEARTACGALAGHRVLVVDDNADAADTVALLLDTHGARARAVYGGPAALAALPGFAPSVVLLDLGMPEMDGFDVARAIRAEGHAQVRIVALTGWGQDSDRRRSQEAGFDSHLVKPLDLDKLTELLAALPTAGSAISRGA